MNIKPLHDWKLTPREAIALQRELAGRVDSGRPLKKYRWIAGADVSYNRFETTCYAAVVVLDAKTMTVVEQASIVAEGTFPYIPGLLSFREAPLLLQAFAQLKRRPDVVMIDGQGRAHPRRVGIASHMGLWLGLPTIGCAKTRLTGTYEEPAPEAGSESPLLDGEELIGAVVRSKTRTKPLFVSVGHRIDLAGAVRVVLETGRGYRIPEPTRQAHLLVNVLRRDAKG